MLYRKMVTSCKILDPLIQFNIILTNHLLLFINFIVKLSEKENEKFSIIHRNGEWDIVHSCIQQQHTERGKSETTYSCSFCLILTEICGSLVETILSILKNIMRHKCLVGWSDTIR